MSIKRETVEQRKALPLASGVLDYFGDALLVVAEVSRVGNEQHHPGEPLHWDKSKSTDEADALLRHLLDRGTLDTDGLRHSGKVAWRALAMLQRELDAEAEVTAQEALAAMLALPAALEAAPPVERFFRPERVQHAVGILELDPDFVFPDHWYQTPRYYEPEPWGAGDGWVTEMPRFAKAVVDNRGEWPPDTRVNGRLTCCGASEHTLACPQYR
jgi:hypothetical protein